MSSSPIKVSVLGAGLSLQAFHYPLISSHPSLFTLHSVFDRSAQLGSNGKVISSKAYQSCRVVKGDEDKVGFKVVNTLEGVVEDDEVELVVIGVPNPLHFPYGKACLLAGKHVLIEKPLTLTLADAEELYNLAKSKGLTLCTYQNRRWDADFLAAQELITSGKLGQINEFTSHFDRYRPAPPAQTWKEDPSQGNQAIWNLGSHVIDQALVIFGKPEKVTCFSYDVRGSGIDDSFLMHLHYPSSHPLSTPHPLLVTLKASMLSPFTQQLRFRISGSKGSYLKYGLDPQEKGLREFDLKKGDKVGGEGWGVEPEEDWGVWEKNVGGNELKGEKYPSPPGCYQVLYQNLHDAIKGKAELVVTAEQVKLTMKVIELGLKSSKLGKTLNVD